MYKLAEHLESCILLLKTKKSDICITNCKLHDKNVEKSRQDNIDFR